MARQAINSAVWASSVIVLLAGITGSATAQEATELRWATSSVGSAGHAVKVDLMAMLNRERESMVREFLGLSPEAQR